MIIEGLLSTHDAVGKRGHVAPMGPIVDPELQQWTLRPFQSSRTFRLLRETPTCIFHVIDDVLPIAQTALGYPANLSLENVGGAWVIQEACHWFRLEISAWDLSGQRSEAQAVVTEQSQHRPFWGWNRAKHAVLEATILATRLHLANADAIKDHLAILQNAIEKTAGPREFEAWQLVLDHIKSSKH